ncbi:hypothetical protein VTJ83DRAFT_6403 [Remersonia thermophila]|uniref:Uncharacterized protein n=1 Tax=Remersonia thermophila TaxID=72144 RepID=A0ABR4D4P2_9PEZI
MASPEDAPPPVTLRGQLRAWGTSAIPGMTLTTLILAQHLRPPQTLPLLFTPPLIFGSYLTLAGFKTDGAGIWGAWSGMYTLLAWRRKPKRGLVTPTGLARFVSPRGVARGVAMGVGAANCVAGLYTYATGDREEEERERRELNRWGIYRD